MLWSCGSNRWLSGILQEMAIFAEIVTEKNSLSIISRLIVGILQSNPTEMRRNMAIIAITGGSEEMITSRTIEYVSYLCCMQRR
ncbi:MAG: hypothetical protein WBP83_09160 [Nitrososphaeraceae archaeon]